MGCCMSSKSERDPSSGDPQLPKSPKLYPPPPKQEPIRSQAAVAPPPPPPPPAEEETVKEVLSETPICPKPPKQPQINIPQEPRCKDQIFITRREEERERTPEISQASEIYSAADSYSTATTATVTEIRDDEVTSKKRVNRSPVKAPRKRPYNGGRERERDVSQRAPARRLPPAKRELTGQGGRTSTPQRNVGSSRVGRDLGERSGRRSRSPATRTAAGGGVKGRAGASPAKVASGKAASEVGGGGVRSEVKKEEKSENENDSVLMRQEEQQQENESLDNPLVSLECFIFL